MGRKYAKYTQEFRESALSRVETAPSISGLCRELGISRQLLYQWRESAERDRVKQGKRSLTLVQENGRLKKLLVQKSLEADFFKGAFERIEALRRSGCVSGETVSSPRSGR